MWTHFKIQNLLILHHTFECPERVIFNLLFYKFNNLHFDALNLFKNVLTKHSIYVNLTHFKNKQPFPILECNLHNRDPLKIRSQFQPKITNLDAQSNPYKEGSYILSLIWLPFQNASINLKGFERVFSGIFYIFIFFCNVLEVHTQRI